MRKIVYRFGLLAPTENAVLVREQMFSAHRHRNDRNQIECGRRAAIRSAMGDKYSDIDVLQKAAQQAEAEEVVAAAALKAERAEGRSKKGASEDAKTRLRDAKAAKKVALEAFRQRRADLLQDVEVQAAIDEINELALGLVNDCYALTDLYWGQRAVVNAAMDAVKKMPLFKKANPNDPRYVQWRGEGQLGLQVHQKGKDKNGFTVEEIRNGSAHHWLQIVSRLRCDAPVAEARTPKIAKARAMNAARRAAALETGGGSTNQNMLLRVRLGTSAGGEPIMAAWPMIMHRSIPEGDVIRKLTVTLRKRGPREEWSVEFTVLESPKDRRCGTGDVAIDLGWRVMDNEIRVAKWKGEDGAEGELRLDKRTITGIRKAEDLRRVRDENFDAAREALSKWLQNTETPEWLRTATTHLGKWKSPGRLAAMARRWKTLRFPGDDEGYAALEAWRYHDHHLWAWEQNQRTGALRHRREVYRRFAAKLAEKYETVVFEDFHLPDVVESPPVDDEENDNKKARSNRHLSAVSELRLVTINAFQSRGGTSVKVSAVNSTLTCNVCGVICAFDAATYLHGKCDACGAVWDQDENAAVNLLERYRAKKDAVTARGDEELNEITEVRETRSARIRRLRAEKEIRMATARERLSK